MPVPEKRSFNQAYAEARKNQELEFEWNGKTYDTRLKEESPRQWLNSMYRDKYFPTLLDQVHNSTIEARLSALDQFTPVNNFGFSPSKNAYLAQINANLSPEYQLTSADFDNWDPYGIKTKTWETLSNTHFDKLDLSMLNADQKRNWIMTATNNNYSSNPYPLTMEKLRAWDPDGSRSEALIRGETPEGLHNLYGKNWLHYNLASALNEGLKKDSPDFSKLFQYNPDSFSSYDPDGSLAASYLMYGQTPPDDGSAMWDKARESEINRWEQHFNAARNHPVRQEFRRSIPSDIAWTNEDGPSISRNILENSAEDVGRNWQYYVDQDPLARKYQQLTELNPKQITADEVRRGVNLSTGIPLAMLTGIYGGGPLLRGLSKLDRFTTRNILKFGSKFLNYSKTPRLINAVSRYGLLNGTIDSAFLGSAIHNYATNPDASWKEIAWGVAPFALASTPVRKGLSWIGNTIARGWQNPYTKTAMLGGVGIGSGITLNNLYNNVYKPYRTKYLASRITSPAYNNSDSSIQYLNIPELKIPSTFAPKTFNSEIKLP